MSPSCIGVLAATNTPLTPLGLRVENIIEPMVAESVDELVWRRRGVLAENAEIRSSFSQCSNNSVDSFPTTVLDIPHRDSDQRFLTLRSEQVTPGLRNSSRSLRHLRSPLPRPDQRKATTRTSS